MRQQQALPNVQVKKRKFFWLGEDLPNKKAALGNKTAAAKPSASALTKAEVRDSANPQSRSKNRKAGLGCLSPPDGSGIDARVRRSGRLRTQAVYQGYVSSTNIPSDSGSDSESDFDSGSDTGSESEAEAVPVGPAHQAILPQLQKRPASGPTSAEAKFLSQPVYTPYSQPLQQQQSNPGLELAPGEFNAMWEAAGAGPARLQLLETWVNRMDAHMGQNTAQSLGLASLGYKLKATWAPHEELLFGLSMLECYRMFKHMKRFYLSKRSVHELNSYYHNVWKPRAGDVAEEFAQLCEQDEDPMKFRLELCTRLAAIWDVSTMGPIPNSAALPPGTATAALSAAAGRTAKTAAANSLPDKATPSTSTAAATAAQGDDAVRPAAASSAPVAVQAAEPPLLVADATAQVVATARAAQKRSKLAVAALPPVQASSSDRRGTLSPAQLPMACRRMALGLQQVRPVDAAAAGDPDTQGQCAVLCSTSPDAAPAVVSMGAGQLPAAEGPQSVSQAASHQQQPQGSWQPPGRVGQQQRSDRLGQYTQQERSDRLGQHPQQERSDRLGQHPQQERSDRKGQHSQQERSDRLGQYPQQQEAQQQRTALPFPAGPTMHQHIPPPAEVHTQQQQQQLAVQVTGIKYAASSLQQQQQQFELPTSRQTMPALAAGPAMGAEHLGSTPQPSCPDHSYSGGCNRGLPQTDDVGCPLPDCQGQSVDANQPAGTPQPGCQVQQEAGCSCISLLDFENDMESPGRQLESHPSAHMRPFNSRGKEAAQTAAARDSHGRCSLPDDVGDVICILD